MSGDTGTFQDGFDCTGPHGVGFAVDLEQQAGILHRVCDDLSPAVVVVQLQIQLAHLRILLQGLKHEVPGRGSHPVAVVLALLQKLKKIARITEGASEVVCEDFLVCHCEIPPFKIFSNPLQERNLDKKRAP